ncbi:MAG: extracellular solute-binding protein [Sphaerochaetaceae bacterium]|jgi:raffinose/stachyose/melibiose transport system substrate-binding protein|nr:extracellular solute-binding protein [Sphaerochaetaceae bacterium]NLO59908.1 extracellular solute-binding protein [Spirochaetales bacterium]MDD2405421.1 extracellular solute-binding protein [Sphaerochaetaceae bacterium]MDD4259438.1 extracellular solute-binding protein [Sphaerochaetaceae bacterium]MDD5075718.1 extracellular solute-binding protein [Sphaerochaetaceae bacterium]
MKKVGVMLVILIMACAMLAAAGVSETQSATEGPATLRVWDIYPEGTPFRAVLDGAIARFNEKYPQVTVEIVSYGDMSNYKTKFATMMAAGGRDADVFQTWGGGQLAAYAGKGLVHDLTPSMGVDGWKERFSPAALSFVSSNEKIWGVPVELANVMFYYNKEIFAKYNLAVPTTFTELLDVCTVLKNNQVIPIVLSLNKAEWVGDMFYQYLVTRVGGLEPFKKAIAREPGGTFEDPVFVEAAKLLRKMVDHGCFQEGFLGTEYASMRQVFTQEKAAMLLMGSWLPGQIASEAPQMYDKVDYFRFPLVEGGKGSITEVVGGTNAAFAISGATKYPKYAEELCREFSSEATANDVLSLAKRLPAAKFDMDSVTIDDLTRSVIEELDTATGIQLYYDQSSTPSLAQTHLSGIAALYAGLTTPEKLATEWEAAAKKELQ